MAHVRMNEQWNSVIEDFERHYPDLADTVVDWYPINRNEIVVQIDNGSKYIYMFIGNKLIRYYEPDNSGDFDEEKWRKEFARKLQRKIDETHIYQDELARRTGISAVSISKYLNCKSSPSGYNIERLAAALNCSVSELTNNRGL